MLAMNDATKQQFSNTKVYFFGVIAKFSVTFLSVLDLGMYYGLAYNDRLFLVRSREMG
jgi:hypothetical protein